MKYVLWMFLAAIVVGIAYLMSDEFNRAGILSSEGYIEHGSKFGIDIGMNVAANRLVEHGLEPVELTATHSCHGRAYGSERRVELWYDRTWRRGTICVSSEENRVASVSWIYNWTFS
ncbi:MAG: hypothetical protein AB7P12_16440 [Alphaproteobacteria bacterium]